MNPSNLPKGQIAAAARPDANKQFPRLARMVAMASMIVLAGCALPRSGPSKSEILSGDVTKGGDTHIVTVNSQIARAVSFQPSWGFSQSFLAAGALGADSIRPGDVLGLRIWENVESGLMTQIGQSATNLEQVQVDGNGNIFVPYAGRVRAAGNTPDGLRQIITQKLGEQTPDPQVMVTRLAGDGATVSVMGKVSGQGVYPIERPTRQLSSMLARAGGVAIDADIAVITVNRGGQSGKVWLRDIYTNSRNDIALRPGDVILVEEDTRNFTALGAVRGQTKVPLGSEKTSAIEAIAMVGGLSTSTADPTGVFVLRDEHETIARNILGGNVQGSQRVAYVLDLTAPSGLFTAREFMIRDGDLVYVTEAPYVQWQKLLGAITGAATNISQMDNLVN